MQPLRNTALQLRHAAETMPSCRTAQRRNLLLRSVLIACAALLIHTLWAAQ